MKIRRFFAKDMKGALAQVKLELGSEAVIMSKTKLADGIEVVAAYDQEPVTRQPQTSVASAQTRSSIGTPRAFSTRTDTAPKASPSLSEIIGDQGPDSLKALLEKQHEDKLSPLATPATTVPEPTAKISTADSKPLVQPANQPADNAAMDDLRDELSSLRNVLQFQVSELFKEKAAHSQPQHQYLSQQLENMGISSRLAGELVSYAPADVSEREAWVFLLKLLANKIHTPQQNLLQTGGVVSLVGPTGTGKTTTLAKLAAQFALQHGPESVAMVTIDSYRIAAYEQLATFGKIIGCTVKKAANSDELADVLYQLKNKKLVLIDTAGFSQRDTRLLSQLATLKSQNYATIKHYLVLQANTQKQALIQSIQSYTDVNIEGCILTKLDETFSLGESLSVVIEQQLPVCFVTDGQKVPEDIKVAESRYLVSSSAKLYQKYNDNVQQRVVSR